jgi:glutamine synthetase
LSRAAARTLAANRSRAAAALVMFSGRTAEAAAGAADRRGVLRQVRAPIQSRRTIRMYEAPVLLKHDRSAAARIPIYSASPDAKRLEFRPPDPLANPYLAFAAMLMGSLDGIGGEFDPGEPIDRNLYELPPEQLAGIPTVPTTLDEALEALEADHAFLTEGDVFTDDLIATYIEFRREQSDRVKIRPHPYEFPMYFDG